MFNYGIKQIGINWVVLRRDSCGSWLSAQAIAVTTSLEAAGAVLRLMEVP